jgi:hypothetical protein
MDVFTIRRNYRSNSRKNAQIDGTLLVKDRSAEIAGKKAPWRRAAVVIANEIRQ